MCDLFDVSLKMLKYYRFEWNKVDGEIWVILKFK